MTDLPGDYGVVLTYALFRGFTDLGPRMTDTYLLFLNADFIICDGSLRHLGKLMLEGKRVIHAPSFRVVLEDVWPKLQAAVSPTNGALAMSAREMVKLALAHKHVTVKARTVNQRLCHQLWMDQFYWYVDEDTLIGYQWPVALVAIKPERVVTEPVLVWDYGFIPEAAPTAPRHFIGDSDDFFMLEPQKRTTGENMVRLGWISIDDIARNLSKWTTREQRECGKQLLVIHAGPLPANLEAVIAELREYMAQVYDRLDPTPKSHIAHSLARPLVRRSQAPHARLARGRQRRGASRRVQPQLRSIGSISSAVSPRPVCKKGMPFCSAGFRISAGITLCGSTPRRSPQSSRNGRRAANRASSGSARATRCFTAS